MKCYHPFTEWQSKDESDNKWERENLIEILIISSKIRGFVDCKSPLFPAGLKRPRPPSWGWLGQSGF